MTSNGRVFESGSIIKAGEQLPTQQILHYCHPIVKKVQGYNPNPNPTPTLTPIPTLSPTLSLTLTRSRAGATLRSSRARTGGRSKATR